MFACLQDAAVCLVEQLARVDADFAWLLLMQLLHAHASDPLPPAMTHCWAALDGLCARAADWGHPSDGRLTRLRPVLDALGDVSPPTTAVRRVRAEFSEMNRSLPQR